MTTISDVRAREVLDSRGNPTVEVDVLLSDGTVGSALVPSGASTGANEALELRDGNASRFRGRGVLAPIANIDSLIKPAVIGRSASDQEALDNLLIELDGTPNKSTLGANAILGVSMAAARAAAQSAGRPLYQHLGGDGAVTLPVPMLNIINGGAHAAGSTDFQEFMVVPAGFDTFREALRSGVEIYHALADILGERGLSTSVGDEGGFAPPLQGNEDAVALVMEAIDRADYRAGEQCLIALDVAASELNKDDYPPDRLISIYKNWVAEYSAIVSIEDGIAEDDWDDWQALTTAVGSNVQLVGDDLFTTNTELVRKGISTNAGNAVLIKLNQIGTVTETLNAVKMTQDAGWGVVISHRSGETEDTTIADLAVGTNAGQIKSGAPARGERTAKYNRLLRIEEELGDRAQFAGKQVYDRFLSNR